MSVPFYKLTKKKMANEFICSDCKGDGTRCRCHENRKPKPYSISPEDNAIKEQLDLRDEWKKLGIDYKPPVLRRKYFTSSH